MFGCGNLFLIDILKIYFFGYYACVYAGIPAWESKNLFSISRVVSARSGLAGLDVTDFVRPAADIHAVRPFLDPNRLSTGMPTHSGNVP